MICRRLFLRAFFALALLLAVAMALPGRAADSSDPATNIATLINPGKLATLGKRGANTRVQKCVYWLATARQSGANVTNLATQAVSLAGYQHPLAAQLTVDALLRNLDIATKLDCLDAAGLDEMRHGKAPTVRRGPYRGDQLSVDHIIPRAVVPELDNVIANLELMPLRLNVSKKNSVGERQLQKAREFHRANLLSPSGLAAVERAAAR
jgi:hypothetical protein